MPTLPEWWTVPYPEVSSAQTAADYIDALGGALSRRQENGSWVLSTGTQELVRTSTPDEVDSFVLGFALAHLICERHGPIGRQAVRLPPPDEIQPEPASEDPGEAAQETLADVVKLTPGAGDDGEADAVAADDGIGEGIGEGVAGAGIGEGIGGDGISEGIGEGIGEGIADDGIGEGIAEAIGDGIGEGIEAPAEEDDGLAETRFSARMGGRRRRGR